MVYSSRADMIVVLFGRVSFFPTFQVRLLRCSSSLLDLLPSLDSENVVLTKERFAILIHENGGSGSLEVHMIKELQPLAATPG